jgi:hypothetical protein
LGVICYSLLVNCLIGKIPDLEFVLDVGFWGRGS